VNGRYRENSPAGFKNNESWRYAFLSLKKENVVEFDLKSPVDIKANGLKPSFQVVK
jgi:hypothetical protein